MNDMRPHPPFRRRIAAQFVGDDHAWLPTSAPQQLTKEALRSEAIALGLDQNVDHGTVLIYCAPEVMLHAVDLQKNLVEKPLGSQWDPFSLPQFLRKVVTELVTPFADGFVGQLNAPVRHHFFHLPIAHGKTEIEPDNLADDFAREPMATKQVRGDTHFRSIS